MDAGSSISKGNSDIEGLEGTLSIGAPVVLAQSVQLYKQDYRRCLKKIVQPNGKFDGPCLSNGKDIALAPFIDEKYSVRKSNLGSISNHCKSSPSVHLLNESVRSPSHHNRSDSSTSGDTIEEQEASKNSGVQPTRVKSELSNSRIFRGKRDNCHYPHVMNRYGNTPNSYNGQHRNAGNNSFYRRNHYDNGSTNFQHNHHGHNGFQTARHTHSHYGSNYRHYGNKRHHHHHQQNYLQSNFGGYMYNSNHLQQGIGQSSPHEHGDMMESTMVVKGILNGSSNPFDYFCTTMNGSALLPPGSFQNNGNIGDFPYGGYQNHRPYFEYSISDCNGKSSSGGNNNKVMDTDNPSVPSFVHIISQPKNSVSALVVSSNDDGKEGEGGLCYEINEKDVHTNSTQVSSSDESSSLDSKCTSTKEEESLISDLNKLCSDYSQKMSDLENAPTVGMYTKKRLCHGMGASKLNNGLLHYPRFSGKKCLHALNHTYPSHWNSDISVEGVVEEMAFGEVKETPPGLLHNNQWDKLSQHVWSKFVSNQQTTDTLRKKISLWRDVQRVVRNLKFLQATYKDDSRNFPIYGLQVVGSTLSGFGSNNSDVDMCLLIRRGEVDQRFEATEKLNALMHELRNIKHFHDVEIIYAKVPILRFRDSFRRLEVDLNCNNYVGIQNTHLLYCYSQMDWRLKPLVLVIKLWAQFQGINDPKNMTISSYSLVLMVIHFLQYGCSEPVLPCLQQMYPNKFTNFHDAVWIQINETIPSWNSENTESLGELLVKFLEYYARKFDYSKHVISVRVGCTLTVKLCSQVKSFKNDPHQWKYLCVEEPFDLTNTARSVYDRDAFDKIHGVFYSSWQRLLVSGDLQSIFTPIPESEARAIAARIR